MGHHKKHGRDRGKNRQSGTNYSGQGARQDRNPRNSNNPRYSNYSRDSDSSRYSNNSRYSDSSYRGRDSNSKNRPWQDRTSGYSGRDSGDRAGQQSPGGREIPKRGTGPAARYYTKLPSYAREIGPVGRDELENREKSKETPGTYDASGKQQPWRGQNQSSSQGRAYSGKPGQQSGFRQDRQNTRQDSRSYNAPDFKSSRRNKAGKFRRSEQWKEAEGTYSEELKKANWIRRKGRSAAKRDFRDINLKDIARQAMKRYGFIADFPKPVIRQVDTLDPATPERAMQGGRIRDLRNLLWSSIDNEDSMDLDQIEYCEQGQNGEIHVKVAIADVDAYVPKSSPADLHAYENTTSVYTGIEVFPMLPDRLSKDLSSLPVAGNRLAMVVEFTVMPNGSVKPGGIYRAVVRNKAKLVYETLGAWLEGTGPMPKVIGIVPGLLEQVKLQDQASLLLGGYRTRQGALELQTIEARPVIQDEKVLGLVVIEANRARHIIENFMIAANGVMSGYLEDRGIPTIQRVVRVPKNWPEIVDFARQRGTKLPVKPNARALTIFLAQQKQLDALRFPDLSLAIVKLLGAGEYVMYDQKNPLGHFCLAVTSYTHATAPNRRYVDLIIQRLLKAALSGARSPYGKNELGQIAEHCTEREMASKKAERFMTKAEAALVLAGKIGMEFDALITGSSEKGVYARLLDPPVEGKLMLGPGSMKVGLQVRVRLVNLDPEKGFIDFELA
ncbi:MAG: RNB domain-containing ribonuclease [Candidatus Micrarchaeia archaeon]